MMLWKSQRPEPYELPLMWRILGILVLPYWKWKYRKKQVGKIVLPDWKWKYRKN